MLNKLYFSMTYSIELRSLVYQLRGLHSLFTIVNKAPELHSSIVLLDYKIKRYVVTQVNKYYHGSNLQLFHEVDCNGNNIIFCELLSGASVPLFYWKLHFDGYVRPGKQPLGKTAVIISRMYPYRPEIEWLADILR